MLPFRSWLPSQCRRLYSTSSPEPIYPEPPTVNHHNLASFLDYAKRADLDPKSTVYVGTRFEYTVQSALKQFGFSLQRTGGASDFGIDLLGTWKVPSSAQPLRVLLQCKALNKKLSPATARELEGAFMGAPSGWRGDGVLALLVSPKASTKGVREALGRSRWPMGFMMCTNEGRILQMLWNRSAEEKGLQGIEVGLRYADGDSMEPSIMLSWKGRAITKDEGNEMANGAKM